ncbi:MAG TPA: type II toxin-antitoxin system VapC family toxin, partial [Thermoanaerobaculia bacterium]
MRFWDTSAILPLLLAEPESEKVEPLLRRDPEVVLWWGTALEVQSALARANRKGSLGEAEQRMAQRILERLRTSAFEIQPLEETRARAVRLLAVHALRAGEALQLAAALVWCRERTRGVSFVCLDERLRGAAMLEGFKVLPYAD